jgi:enamidase
LIDADMVIETGTDVIGHINGGHSALPDDQIICLCESCSSAFEIVHNGNERSAVLALNTARELGKLDQIILGTDGPAGSGVQPLGIMRMIAMLSAFGNIPAEIAFCFGHGNTSRQRNLDTGLIEAGYAADFVILDKAQHAPGKTMLESVQLGNLPGVGMTIIDGEVTSGRSRNTPPADRLPEHIQ